MKLDNEILFNKYGQSLIELEFLLKKFEGLDIMSKRSFLNEVIFLILQSKPKEEDIELAITNSGLKPTFTPCVLLKKGVTNHNLEKLAGLPETELNKVFLLFSSLFKIAYKRRFEIEKNNPNKWWYWDLSDEENLSKIFKI